MSVIDKLAGALGRNDERPNVALAEALVAKPDAAAIRELVAATGGSDKDVANDAIKVLYEIGERNPALIKGNVPAFAAGLKSRNNRMVWGALSAIAAVAGSEPKAVAAKLDHILAAADKGSVIAKDMAIKTLAGLAAAGEARRTVPLLLARLRNAAPNQFPMYCEIAAPVVDLMHRAEFRAILEARLAKIPQPAKRTRVERILKKLG